MSLMIEHAQQSWIRYAVALLAATTFIAVHPTTAAADTVWLPAVVVGHPLAVCHGGLTESEAADLALEIAEGTGFEPPLGADTPEFLLLERLTAIEADRKYDRLRLTTDLRPLEAWECVWVTELRGRKKVVGGRRGPREPTPGGPTATPVYWEWLSVAFHDTRHVVVGGYSLSTSIGPTYTPSPTRVVTPGASPTLGTPTALPTPVSPPP